MVDALEHVFGDRQVVRRLLGMREADLPGDRATSSGLTEQTRQRFAGAFCPTCLATTIPTEDLREMQDLGELRPTANFSIDQHHVQLHDLLRRVRFVLRSFDVNGKRILCVGDADFFSIALCTLSRPQEVVVIDRDERVLQAIAEIATKRHLPIVCSHYDLRDVLKSGLPDVGPTDVFMTDPPFTIGGAMAFVYTGLKLLTVHGEGFIAYPTSDFEPWAYPYLYQLEQFLLGNGAVILEKINNFHVYEDNEGGVTSGIIRIRKLVERQIALPQGNPAFFYYHSYREWEREHGG